MARYPNGVNFKFKKPLKPREAKITFALLRVIRDFSAKELAEQGGVARSTVYKLRNRRTRNPSGNTLEKLADVAGLTLAFVNDEGRVYEGSDAPMPPPAKAPKPRKSKR